MAEDEDEYDLVAVEAQLARMQLQRQQRSRSQPLKPSVEPELTATCGFALDQADLSSESEDSDCESMSTNSVSSDDDGASGLRRHTKPKTRLRDSLDLSMSIAELPKPRKLIVNSLRSKQPANPALLKPEPVQDPQQHDARISGGSPDLKARSGDREPAVKDHEDDTWMSNLVRRRRQLEKDAALTKDQQFVHTTVPAAIPSRLVQPNARASRPTAPAAVVIETEANAKDSRPVPARAPEMPVKTNVGILSKCSSKSQINTAHHVHFAPEDQDDDDDDILVSVEEEKLRQSLEKLDSRLTKLSSSDTRQRKSSKLSSQPGNRAAPAKASGRPLPTTGPRHERDDEGTVQVADLADDDVVAAGAYGGGAHCKSGQVTSVLERSCYTRRAEMSSGLHKLRVRTGGAMAQENSNSSLDKDGKHKVVVKKDLAHLLF